MSTGTESVCEEESQIFDESKRYPSVGSILRASEHDTVVWRSVGTRVQDDDVLLDTFSPKSLGGDSTESYGISPEAYQRGVFLRYIRILFSNLAHSFQYLLRFMGNNVGLPGLSS